MVELVQNQQNLIVLDNSVDKYINQLREKQKLILILDIDHTIVDQDSSNTNNSNHSIKIRPLTKDFLEKVSQYYDILPETSHGKDFLNAAMQVVDSEHKYFNFQNHIVKDFLTIKIHADENSYDYDRKISMLQIKPFYWKDDDKNDDTLTKISNIIVDDIHHNFFKSNYDDVFVYVFDFKRKVFKDCYILLDGLWKADEYDKKKKLISKAEAFGATITLRFVPYVTHIVTENPSKELIEEAMTYDEIFIVDVKWLLNSCLNFERDDEDDYQVDDYPVKTYGSKPRSLPPIQRDINSTDFDELMKYNSSSDSEFSDSDESSSVSSYSDEN